MRVTQRSIVLLIVLGLLGPALPTGAAPPPEADVLPARAAPPAADDVPETWILAPTKVEGQTLQLAERWRVLPGGQLDIVDSTLTFDARPEGLTGIVAEPGSEVRILRSTLAGPAGAFLVHLEGDARLDASSVLGAARVVVQPRSLTDHADETLGPATSVKVPGWRAARTLTNASALLRDTTVEGPGPALVVGSPLQYQGSQPPTRPAVRLEGGVLRASQGPALLCYATTQQPDPDGTLAVPLVAGTPTSQLDVAGTTLESPTGPVLHCPPAPVAFALPARNLPAGLDAPLLPPPPSPEALPGPALVRMDGGVLRGGGVGALLDGATRLQATDAGFEGLDPAVRVAAATAAATLTRATGQSLGSAAAVAAGTLEVTGGDLAGAGAGTGVAVTGGSATLSGTRLRGFATGLWSSAAPSVTAAQLEDMAVCARLVASTGGSIAASTFRGCGSGLLLERSTGASVTNNQFLENLDPLRVLTPDPSGTPAHFNHTVTGNTVHGKQLVYLFQRTNTAVTAAAGHAVVAHSSGVRVAQLDVTHGGWQVEASTEVVLGAPTDLQAALLARADPAAAQAFQSAWRGVRFELYPGALKGPQGTRDQASGNSLDQSWLLIDDLRKQGRTARFVQGQLSLPLSAYQMWVGVEDLNTALTVWGLKGSIQGSTLRMDHTWAEVQVAPGLWLEADPSFEAYDWVPAPDWRGLVGLMNDTFYHQYVANLTVVEDGLRNIPVAMLEDEVHAGHARAQQWLAERPGLTHFDLLGGPRPRAVQPGEEPARTPASRLADLPTEQMWSVRLRTSSPFGPTDGEIDLEATTPSLYGKRVALASQPLRDATWEKLATQGGIYGQDRHGLPLHTLLWIDDVAVDSDGKWRLPNGTYELRADPSVKRVPGDLLGFAVDVRAPGPQHILTKTSNVRVGGTYAVALDIGATSANLVQRAVDGLETTLAGMTEGTPGDGVSHEALWGHQHWLRGMYYHLKVHEHGRGIAAQQRVLEQPLVTVAVTGQPVVPVAIWTGTKWEERVEPMPPYIDVQSLANAYARRGSADDRFGYYFGAGIYSSLLEDHVFAELHNLPSVSSIKIMNHANAVGQTLYQVNATNLERVLAKTSLPQAVEDAIRSAVARGRQVLAHSEEVTYLAWKGAAWIEIDMATGAAGWLIRGSAQPTLGHLLAEPEVMNGGSGASWEPVVVVGPSGEPVYLYPYDGGYMHGNPEDAGGLGRYVEWAKDGAGGVLDYYGSDSATWSPFRTKAEQAARPDFFNRAEYGYKAGQRIFLGNDAPKGFSAMHRKDLGQWDVPQSYAKVAKVAGWATVAVDSYMDYNEVMRQEHRPVEDRYVEIGGRVAYNVASGAVVAAAAGKGVVAGAAICTAVPGLGTAACGFGGGVIAGIGAGLATGWLKRKIFG